VVALGGGSSGTIGIVAQGRRVCVIPDLQAKGRAATLTPVMDEATFDKKTIVVATLAILGFVVLGVAVAVFGAPDEPPSVLARRSAPTSAVDADVTESSTTSTTVAEPLEVVFEPVLGLGFEQQRRWTYDVGTKSLENVVEFRPDRPELLIAYTEVLPPSLVDLGEFELEPLTDDVATLDDGTEKYSFMFETTADEPGELRWSVVTQDTLTASELDQLAADRNAAEEASVTQG
jgi:hypothetical protein